MTLTDEEIQGALEWCEGSDWFYVKDDEGNLEPIDYPVLLLELQRLRRDNEGLRKAIELERVRGDQEAELKREARAETQGLRRIVEAADGMDAAIDAAFSSPTIGEAETALGNAQHAFRAAKGAS